MIRHAAAVAVAVCLSPSWLCAQSTEFTVSAVSADVHKGPSTGSPVIGTASRGRVLTVTRELGSWVRISWPTGIDGIGYVHVSMGRIGGGSDQAAGTTVRPAATRLTPDPVLPPARGGQEGRVAPVQQPTPTGSTALEPTAHLVGLGGRMGGSTLGFGASARAAIHDRFGVQLEVARYGVTNALTQQRLTSVQFAPSLLYSLPDRITDYVWLRPYLGAGLTWYRSTLGSATTPAADGSVTDVRVGRQFFGGTEAIFAAVPRFALSADYGYRWSQAPFGGFDLGGRGLSVSGHWYVK